MRKPKLLLLKWLLGTGLGMLSVSAAAQQLPQQQMQPPPGLDLDVPPPPPPPSLGGASAPQVISVPQTIITPEAATANRYQACFQRMVDAGINDNAYMRRCLGLPPRAQGTTSGQRRPHAAAAEPSSRELAGTVQQNLGPLTDCYDNLLMTNRDLGLAPTGKVGALIEIQPSGQAEVLAWDPKSLPDAALLACFRSRMHSWVLPKRGDHPRYYVSFVLTVKAPLQGQVAMARGFPQPALPREPAATANLEARARPAR